MKTKAITVTKARPEDLLVWTSSDPAGKQQAKNPTSDTQPLRTHHDSNDLENESSLNRLKEFMSGLPVTSFGQNVKAKAEELANSEAPSFTFSTPKPPAPGQRKDLRSFDRSSSRDDLSRRVLNGGIQKPVYR